MEHGIEKPGTLLEGNDSDFAHWVWCGCAATAAHQEGEVRSDKGTDSLLEKLEETVQSNYQSVLEDAMAAMKRQAQQHLPRLLMTSNELVLARLDAIDRQLAYLIYKLS